jgi:hypothetical protein
MIVRCKKITFNLINAWDSKIFFYWIIYSEELFCINLKWSWIKWTFILKNTAVIYEEIERIERKILFQILCCVCGERKYFKFFKYVKHISSNISFITWMDFLCCLSSFYIFLKLNWNFFSFFIRTHLKIHSSVIYCALHIIFIQLIEILFYFQIGIHCSWK